MAEARYRVTRFIKRGGMAEVHEGLQIADGGELKRVAIKRLLPHESTTPWFRRAFHDEARIASCLVHPGIVGLLDYGVMDGRPFQILEYVEGADLADLLGEAQSLNLPLPRNAALHVVIEVARALEYVHNAVDSEGKPLGVVHRDVTPGNILLSWDGQVKLTDFGIARALDRLERTAVGIVKGKLSYLAPELIRGEQGDHRIDVFALGCVLHEALTGKSPMESRHARDRAITGGIPSLEPALPPEIAAIVRRALEPDPNKRFASAEALAQACEGLLIGTMGARGQLVEWLSSVQARERHKTPAPLAEMFEMRLLAQEADGMPRFASVLVRREANPIPAEPEVTQGAGEFTEESTTNPGLASLSVSYDAETPPTTGVRRSSKEPRLVARPESGLGDPPTVIDAQTMVSTSDPLMTATMRTLNLSEDLEAELGKVEVETRSDRTTPPMAHPSVAHRQVVIVSTPVWMRVVTALSLTIALISVALAVHFARRGPEVVIAGEPAQATAIVSDPLARQAPGVVAPGPEAAGTSTPTDEADVPASEVGPKTATPRTRTPTGRRAPGAARREPTARLAPAAEEVGSIPDDLELERRLGALASKLKGAAAALPLEELTPLEDRYLDLRGSFRAGLAPDRRVALGRRLTELEREIDRRH